MREESITGDAAVKFSLAAFFSDGLNADVIVTVLGTDVSPVSLTAAGAVVVFLAGGVFLVLRLRWAPAARQMQEASTSNPALCRYCMVMFSLLFNFVGFVLFFQHRIQIALGLFLQLGNGSIVYHAFQRGFCIEIVFLLCIYIAQQYIAFGNPVII